MTTVILKWRVINKVGHHDMLRKVKGFCPDIFSFSGVGIMYTRKTNLPSIKKETVSLHENISNKCSISLGSYPSSDAGGLDVLYLEKSKDPGVTFIILTTDHLNNINFGEWNAKLPIFPGKI